VKEFLKELELIKNKLIQKRDQKEKQRTRSGLRVRSERKVKHDADFRYSRFGDS